MKSSSGFDTTWQLPQVCNLLPQSYSHSCFYMWELLLCLSKNWVQNR